jgi:hypothetical protein
MPVSALQAKIGSSFDAAELARAAIASKAPLAGSTQNGVLLSL